MNFDDRLRQKAEKETIDVPEEFSNRIKKTLEDLPPAERKAHKKRSVRWVQALSVAAVSALVILPNTSSALADTMGSLPVVGPLFQVVTIQNYQRESGRNHVSISNPQITPQEPGTGAEEINRQVEQYTNQLIEDYEASAKADGYFNLDVTWEIITNTEHWFTLRINSDMVLATGNHQEQHYHIDVASGEQKTLSDLFPENFDYVSVISDELKKQMQARMEEEPMEIYWLEGISELGAYYFDAIDPEQDFYFDSEGRIVIPFDKYEVGPGTTGSPEFTLTSPELYENLLFQP